MEELQKLFNVLKREGYYTKSFEDFQSQYQDETYRDKVFNVVSRDGFYTKSKEEFLSKYSLGEVKKKEESEPSLEEVITESTTEQVPAEDGSSVSQQDDRIFDPMAVEPEVAPATEQRIAEPFIPKEQVQILDEATPIGPSEFDPEKFVAPEQPLVQDAYPRDTEVITESTTEQVPAEDGSSASQPIGPSEFDPEKFVAPEEPLFPGETPLDIENRKNQADAIFDRLNRQKSIRDELIKQKVEKGDIDESDIDLESVVQEKFPELKDQVNRELSAQYDWINKFGTLEGYETEEDFFEGAFGSALKTFDDVTYIGLGEFVDDLARAVMSGRAQGNVAEATNDLLIKGSMSSNNQIDKFIEAQKQAGEYQMSAEMRKYIKTSEEEGGGFLGMIFGLAENPSILLEVAATSFASMAANKESLNTAAIVLEAGMAYGAGAGITTGSALGGVGALPGAAIGSVTGFSAAIPFAFGAASTVLEAGSKFSELLLEELGDKPLNRENIKNMLNDKEAYKKIRNKAIIRGLAVGIIDTAFGLIGSSVGAKMISKGAGKGKVLAVTTGFEGAGGATGEVLGTVAIGETPTWSDVGLEFFAETPGSAKTFIQSQIKATDPAKYKINGNTVNESVIKDVVESMTPEELADSDINIENDKDLSDKVQNKIVKGAVKEQISQAKPELNDATVDKIADLQMEADKLKDNKTQAGKRKIAELNEQMKELEDSPIEEAPEVKVEEEVTEEVAPEVKVELEQAKTPGERITTTEEQTLFKGMQPKIKDGKPFSAHKKEKGEFAAVDKKLASNYKGDKPLKKFTVPAGTTIDVVKVEDTNQPVSKVRKQEVKLIDDSDAQVVKLITRDAGGIVEEQYIIKDDSILETAEDVVEEVAPEVEVAPEPKEVRYEMNKTDKKIWRKDFEIVDNRDGKELGPPKENGKWVVVNKVTGQVVIATSKRDAQSIIDNAPADPELFGEGQIVDADQIITPETGIEITEEATPEVTEEESSLLSEMEDIDGQIEEKQEEISIEQGNTKEKIASIDSEIKEVRSSKIDKQSKAERIDELKAEKSDYKDSQKSIIQDYKDDIKDLQKEKKKAERKIKKISDKKPAVKAKPKETKRKVVEQSKTMDVLIEKAKEKDLNSKRKIAKNTANKKAGMLSSSISNIRKIFNTDASIIPESVLSDYESLIEMFGKKDAVVSLDKISNVKEMVSNVVKGLNEKYSALPELIKKYSEYEKKQTYTQTIDSMFAEGVISLDEFKLMDKYENEILSEIDQEVKIKTEEQEQKQRKNLIKEIGKVKPNKKSIDSLDTRLERDDANNFFKLLKTKGLENLSTYDLKNISKIADNINNGYFTSYAKKISTNISSNNKALNLANDSIKKAKPLPISKFIGNVKSLFTNRKSTNNRKGTDEMIRRNPLKYIDNLFGDFKTTTIFDTVFKPIAEAYSRYKNQNDVVNIRIQNAQDKVFKSLGYDSNKFTTSSFKQMAYMIQREFLSNPDSKQVNSASDILNATIKKSKELKGFYDERDIQAFENILKDYTVDDVFDNEKLYDSFNKAEKESIDTITDINQSMTPMAEYVSNIIYGEPIETLDNYISLNVLPEVKDTKTRGIIESEAYKNSLKPNAKSKLLIKRTGEPSAINMDVYSSVSNSSKKLLMDYHLSDTIRGTYKTLEDARKLIDSNSKKQLNTLNAIENAFNEALSNVLDTTFIETSFADDVLNYMTKTGYRTMLASAPRFVAELGSNLAFAAINSPTEFARGMKLAEFTSADNGSIIMNNVGSVNTSRIFGFDELSGKLVDSSLINKTQGRESGKMRGTVMNTLTKLVNKSATIGKYDASLKSSYKAIEGVADKLISTPDKIVMQRLWMGTFDVEFKKITGKSPDFQKILKNDEAYMNENAKALDAAKKKADNKSTQTGATDNPFMGILKGTVKPNQSTIIKGYNVFNKFMTKFLHFEYAAARTGIYAMVGRGEMSRKQGAALLAAVTVRMTLYTVSMSILTEIMLKISNEIFGDEVEDEELLYADEKSFYQKLGQSLASSFTQLILGRDFGNAFKSIINAGVEWFNEEQLQFLRNGDYDPYKDAIQFNLFQKTGREEQQSDLGDVIMKIGGPLTPYMKSINFLLKQATAPEKTKAEAIVRQNREKTDRLFLEIFGNLNMIPFYRDVKKMVYQDIYKDLTIAEKKSKIEKQAMEEKLMGYENEKDMKTNDYSLWEVQFGPKSEGYDEKLAEKRLKNLQRRINKIIKEGGDINYVPAFRGGEERPRRKTRSSRTRR